MALVYSSCPHRDISYMLPLIGLEILPWPKIITWSSDGRMNGQPERSMPPAGCGCGGIKMGKVCSAPSLENI